MSFASRDVMLSSRNVSNQCCQLLQRCPASTVTFVRFTDEKLLKFHLCRPKKRPKRSCLRACGPRGYVDFYTFWQDNALTRRDRETVEFLARETPDFIAPELLRADTVNSFPSVNLTKFIVEATETNKLVVTTQS